MTLNDTERPYSTTGLNDKISLLMKGLHFPSFRFPLSLPLFPWVVVTGDRVIDMTSDE